MDDVAKRIEELRAQSDQQRYEFLSSDLALCFTFADLVQTELELDHRENAQHVFESAERGHHMIRHLLGELKSDSKRIELQTDLDALRKRLNEVGQRFWK